MNYFKCALHSASFLDFDANIMEGALIATWHVAQSHWQLRHEYLVV